MKLLSIMFKVKTNFHKITSFFYSLRIGHIGKGSYVVSPLHFWGKGVRIGDHSIIQYKSWIVANPLTGSNISELVIGNGCAIGHFCEIYATKSIVIEDNVLIADRCYISDNLHAFKNPKIPIIRQEIQQIGTVRIGEGSWIGVGVAIIGCNIGKHCVIGANAVVTHDIPDYCVAVGAPAKVIKRYNFDKGLFERVREINDIS